MKKIQFMLIVVIVLLTSFLAPIKVGGRGGGGIGGGAGGVIGNPGGGGGFSFNSPPAKDPNAPGTGYKGGTIPGSNGGKVVGGGYKGGNPIPNPQPGDGNTGPPLIVIPKPPQDDPPKKGPPMPMPQQCKPEVRKCINTYVYGGVGRPKYHGSCCLKLKHSVKCVCKFLKSQDADLRDGANGVLKGCHYRLRKPCPK